MSNILQLKREQEMHRKTLMEAYEDKCLKRKVGLLKQLVQLKLSDGETMQEYVN